MAVAIYPGTLSACMHCLTVLNSTAKLLGSPYSMHAAVAPRCGRQLASTAAQIALLEPTKAGARLKTSGGASHRLVDDAENGLAASVLTAPPAGPLTDAALFIDQNAQQLKTTARARVPQACLLVCLQCLQACAPAMRYLVSQKRSPSHSGAAVPSEHRMHPARFMVRALFLRPLTCACERSAG